LDVCLGQKWTGGGKYKDLRFRQVFKWDTKAKNGPIFTPKWGKWRGMDLNHQPRAYEAYSYLIHLSIPKTRLIAFSFGRAGLNPLDFSEALVNTTRPNTQSEGKTTKSIKIPLRVSETLLLL
jgi:hypothetical protein